MWPYLIAILATLLTLFSGAAAIAFRTASRTILLARLKLRENEELIKTFDLYRDDYAILALTHRQLGILAFILSVDRMVPQELPAPRRIALVALFCAAWLLLFGISIPAAWSRHAGEPFLARLLPLMESLRALARPLLFLFHAIDELIRRLAGAPTPSPDRTDEMERDILDAVSQAEYSGAVDESEKQMIKSVMLMDETSVGEIMTPRTDMIGIDVASSFDEARTVILDAGHSRIPVFEETLDHVIGVLYAKDLLAVTNPAQFSLRQSMRSVPFVPETKDVASLLREFQSARVHMAIVLDEYGGTAGLVTIEDIIEEVVGEIADEHEDHEPPPIRRIDSQTAEIDARTHIEQVNESLEIRLPENDGYDTLGGYVFSRLGRIPETGETFQHENIRFDVLEADERSIRRLRLHLPQRTANSAQA